MMPMTGEPAGPKLLGAAPSLTVPDVLRAATFYRDVLGFESDSTDEWFAILSRDGFSVLLWQGAAAPNGSWDACFWVDDVDALHRELAGRGAIIQRPPETMPYGMREMTARDGDGHVLAFLQHVGS